MTAVAAPPSFQPISRSSWGPDSGDQAGLNSMSTEEVTRMFMPRKTAQRTNSSSSLASAASESSTSTVTSQPNGIPPSAAGDLNWASRKKPSRGLWPSSKGEPTAGLSNARPHPIATMGPNAASGMPTVHQPPALLPPQHLMQGQPQQQQQQPPQHQQQQQQQQQQNGVRPPGETSAMLCLLPMNGTFERKTIGVPCYPDNLRIGRQTNAKTLPTPANGYFDSKVLSRQHAEIWSDRLGKIWIKDVKSSNGTFVNGQRLSAENRDSEPHELRESDILELGIDIVSEDQKTVVHHKVAARVEHAGFYGNSTNVMDLNFGDIDPTVGGGMMAPSLPQAMSHMRGRNGSQGSMGSNGRMNSGPPSVAGSNASAMGQQRHMNFWLTPVSIEQIVKRLSSDLKTAKGQSSELLQTGEFFNSLVTDGVPPEDTKLLTNEQGRGTQPNGIPLKTEPKARFSDPPAPPPQQPLPEKPNSARGAGPDFNLQASLRRSDTEKPKIPSSQNSPSKESHKSDSSHQITSLVEALASAKRELDSQSVRVKDLEDMLQQERIARETAEGKAQRLELEKSGTITKDFSGVVPSDVESLLDPSQKQVNGNLGTSEKELQNDLDSKHAESSMAEESAARLKQRVDQMVLEMDEMRLVVEKYKQRAETAEAESATTRQSLAEMIETIRRQDEGQETNLKKKQAAQDLSASSRTDTPTQTDEPAVDFTTPDPPVFSLDSIVKQARFQQGKHLHPDEVAALEKAVSTVLMRGQRSNDRHGQLVQSAPYASIFGVVIIGVGLMAFLNGWQKVER
ncbi:MAG: subunit of TIM23 translocase complex [Chaenotheca gracillima]|nr:MAG: subunit of TIM23 translocase complex [Chaenotheca gracillima]